jgi:hypothetical protein
MIYQIETNNIVARYFLLIFNYLGLMRIKSTQTEIEPKMSKDAFFMELKGAIIEVENHKKGKIKLQTLQEMFDEVDKELENE